jgi:hypothetical protein
MAWCHRPSGSAETKSSAIRQALQLKMINQYRSVTTAFRKADKDASGKLEVGNGVSREDLVASRNEAERYDCRFPNWGFCSKAVERVRKLRISSFVNDCKTRRTVRTLKSTITRSSHFALQQFGNRQ